MIDLASQLGLAGAIITATIVLLREIRKQSNGVESSRKLKHSHHNGRVQALEDRTQGQIDRLENKLQTQGVQLDDLSREQSQTRTLVERQAGKLDTILEMLRR